MKRALYIPILILFILTFNACGTKSGSTQWEKAKLSAYLPVPDSNETDIILDSPLLLQADVHHISNEEYAAYTESCQKKGFTKKIMVSNTISSQTGNTGGYITDSFSASNSDGYLLEIGYNRMDELMSVVLSATE